MYLDLYPFKPIFSEGVTPLFSVEDAAQFCDEIQSIRGHTTYLNWVFNSAMEHM